MRSNDFVSEQNSNQGNFLTGFVVGMLAGGAGLFLFGTDDGKKVRKSLNKEWDKAKQKMVQEGVIENSSLSLREIVSSIFEKFEKVGKDVVKSQNSLKTSKKSSFSRKQKTAPKKKKSLKFRGV